MSALVAPTVNAYKRLKPASLNGYFANWGLDHRGTAVRVPPARGQATRLEHRIADGATAVHVAAAATLISALRGVKEEMECPPAETQDCIDGADTDITVRRALALPSYGERQSYVAAFSDYVEVSRRGAPSGRGSTPTPPTGSCRYAST
jgi:glutamine synthetase